MEHGVYICTWARSPDGFTLWVKGRPHVRASAPTYPEAESQLIDSIQSTGGAMHAVLEFDPPLPKSDLDQGYSIPELYLICGDTQFETDAPRRTPFESEQEVEARLRWLDTFYEKPVCRNCRQTSGRRNDRPIMLASINSKTEGAFGTIGMDGGPTHQVFSEQFIAQLTLEEKRRLNFQAVSRKRGRKFFELIGPEGPAPVAVIDLKVSGWRCHQCGYHTWGYWNAGTTINVFVPRSDLPIVESGLFTVGTFPEVKLGATANRRRELLGRAGTRGLVSSPLGVAPIELEHLHELCSDFAGCCPMS